jgi:hypothetical protein
MDARPRIVTPVCKLTVSRTAETCVPTLYSFAEMGDSQTSIESEAIQDESKERLSLGKAFSTFVANRHNVCKHKLAHDRSTRLIHDFSIKNLHSPDAVVCYINVAEFPSNLHLGSAISTNTALMRLANF